MLKSKLAIVQLSVFSLLLGIAFSGFASTVDDKVSANLQAKILNVPSSETVTVFIYLRDKGSDIDHKIATAKAELSVASLKRRAVNRGIDNLVSYTDIPVNPEYLKLIKSKAKKIRHSLRMLNAVSIEATPLAIKEIAQYNFVQSIDTVVKLKRSAEPEIKGPTAAAPKNSKGTPMSSGLTFDYGSSFTQNNQINVPAVHDLGYSGNGVTIAVFDAGFNRLSHESFNQMTIAGAWDFVNGDSDVGDGTDIGEGSHGTKTLSTIGGFSPGNLIGPAYGATYYLAKTENTESELHLEEDNWCAAAEWAEDNGAQIISSSLGYTDFDSGTDYTPNDMDGDTTVITICADLIAQNGIVVINSAGNNGAGSGENTLGAPSDGHYVIAVGGVTSGGSRSSFSSVGPSADGRIKPDVMTMGSSVVVASPSSDTGYYSSNGTSFSCPLSAGVAALIVESNPNLSAAQVRDIMRNSADRRATPDNLFGYGILDALAAVNAALDASSGIFAPSASFSVVMVSTMIVDFTSTSTDSDGTIDNYQWDFGDGNVSTDENPRHTYVSTGSYTVTLTVTDNSGQSDSVSRSVIISSPEPTPTTNSRSSGGGSSNKSSIGFIFLIGLAGLLRRLKAL